MIEREYKTLLKEAEFETIKNVGYFQKKRKQVNTYYDTKDLFLYRRSETLRIRKIDDINYIQYKSCPKFNEINQERSEIQLLKFTGIVPLKIMIPKYTNLCFSKIGSLVTVRYIYENENFSLNLDKNLYLGKIDYELEIEYKNDKKGSINMLSKGLNINHFVNSNRINRVSKNKRFIDRVSEGEVAIK